MEGRWVLVGEGKRLVRLTRSLENGQGKETVSPVLTVVEVCRILRRSRRQVYRYIHRGNLKPCVRILDQWLFAKEEVERFRRDRALTLLRPFFWDIKLSDLDTDRHRDFILARLLEYGDQKALRWARWRYSKNEFIDFLENRGADILPIRDLLFWAKMFGAKKAEAHARSSGRRRANTWPGTQIR